MSSIGEIIDNATNINILNDKSVSLSKVLLIFYVLLASNYTKDLLSKQIKTFIEDNRLVQHAIAFIAMLILITSIGGVVDINMAIIYSLIGYFWFIFSTKLDAHINVVIVLLLLAGYLYENKIDEKESNVKNDKILSTDQKNIIINKNRSYKKYFTLSVFLVTVTGTMLYSNKKQVQYGGGFDLVKYLFY